MALPLEPESGLFPDTFVEPFIRAPELEELADDVIASFDEFEPIQTAIREGLRLTYVWETKPFDPSKDELQPHTIAKVTKASPLWKALAETELVIQFRQAFWAAFSDDQRRAVVHHELTHIEVDEGLKISLRKHDVEDFRQTIRRFGPILPGRAALVKAALDWQHEQERPGPTPLRPVGEAAIEATIDAAESGGELVKPLQDIADRTGNAITISAQGRSATISPKARKDKALADATANRLGRRN